MLALISVCLVAISPMLTPPHWAWAQIDRDELTVKDSYMRADPPGPTVYNFVVPGPESFEHFKLNDLRVYRKDGTELGASWLRDKTNPLRGPYSFGIDVVISVWVLPSADRLKQVSDDTPIIVLPRPVPRPWGVPIQFD